MQKYSKTIVLTGISIPAIVTERQNIILSQWMGCARYIWNAKTEEFSYFLRFAQKYCPSNMKLPIDQSYSQFKDKELSFWLYCCPSQILRNSISNWYKTYLDFLSGKCGKPKKKKKSNKESIHLTKELFSFKKNKGRLELHIGTKTRNLGVLKLNLYTKKFTIPKSIIIIKENGKYRVCFSYNDDLDEDKLLTQKEHLDYLKGYSEKELESITIGIDRGVKRPIQAGDQCFDLTLKQKKKKRGKERYIKRCQKKLSKLSKCSNRRKKIKQKLGRAHKKIQNIRKNFCHQVSSTLINNSENKIFILEDLKTRQMVKKPKPKKEEKAKKWKKNGAKAKAGLNRNILDKGWYLFEVFLTYKAHRKLKALFKISAHYTSQECSDCSYTHPNNRKSQEVFLCENCGHFENADSNASKTIKRKAINLIRYSGTELSKRGVLLDIGRGAKVRHMEEKPFVCSSNETSKKKRLAINC